jgi:tetratricopeptide (TPR) repeat protein
MPAPIGRGGVVFAHNEIHSNPCKEHTMTRWTRRLIGAAALSLALTPVLAADMEPAPPKAADKLAAARTHIAAKRWSAALDELRRVNDSGSADWNNLMGYSLRKSKTADYASAEKYYDEALRIVPTHRGALEYSGELYLITGDLGKAEQRLGTLEKACAMKCEEYADLKKAVAKFKAAGNKYVAEP